MATTTRDEEDRLAFEDAIQSLEAQMANLGVLYAREIRKMAD